MLRKTNELQFGVLLTRKTGRCLRGWRRRPCGLPLAIVFASHGLNVLAIDLNDKAIATISQGKMPFQEKGAEPILQRVLAEGRLALTTDSCCIRRHQDRDYHHRHARG